MVWVLRGLCWTLVMAVAIVICIAGVSCSAAEAGVATSDLEPSPSSSSAGVLSCEVARMKCAFRVGCGMALQNYMVGCSDEMSGRRRRCSDQCKKALIALTSTEEGQVLMRCDCQGQEFCDQTKQRVEICRPEVMRANEEDAIVSCSVAQWICAADPLCSTAVEYYRRLCRSMFHGKKCTMRCNNSISILNRQEKAAKLKTCVCDGTEDYDCRAIKQNMDRLCFHKYTSEHHHHAHRNDHHSNEIQGDSPGGDKPKHRLTAANSCSAGSSERLRTALPLVLLATLVVSILLSQRRLTENLT